ncbi:S1C family serine protease [Bacillus niameyensis]|uniref:S1C family serine protease n=1 Tax=Bacillus niameyensis TaxID=1522308 RepID=UPI0007849ADA
MGYYDDHSPNRSNRRGGKSAFFTGLIGGIIGALLVVMIYPSVVGREVSNKQNENVEAIPNEGNAPSKNVSLNVKTDVTEAIERAGKSVVGITNIQASSFWSNSENQEAGVGSGVIYKQANDVVYIVTNHHVVEGATQLEVTLSNGTKVSAELRGSDVWTDLAVVEVKSNEIEADMISEFGDSDSLKIGEPVMAIGNPLGLQFSGSVTQGIISGVNRTVPVDINNDGIPDWQAEVIQTDAAINPGNSGGALVNIGGQIVGINSMKIAQEAVEGIGFSIPINYVIPVIEDLEKFGEVRRPAMGVTLRNVSEIAAYHQQQTLKLPKDIHDGVMIESVVPNSPAGRAGLKELDVIVEMDGNKIEDILQLRKYLYNEKNVGDSLTIKFYRNGEISEATLKLAEENRM